MDAAVLTTLTFPPDFGTRSMARSRKRLVKELSSRQYGRRNPHDGPCTCLTSTSGWFMPQVSARSTLPAANSGSLALPCRLAGALSRSSKFSPGRLAKSSPRMS